MDVTKTKMNMKRSKVRFNNEKSILPLGVFSLDINTMYKITDMLFVELKSDRKIIVIIENMFGVFLPNRTYHFLNTHGHLFNRMVESTKDYHLGMRVLDETSDRIEFSEL